MHTIQQKILELSKMENLSNLTLREIAEKIKIKISSPQLIKHHILQLEKKGFDIYNKKTSFLDIPILGTADCGNATTFAEEKVEGYIKISPSFLNISKNKHKDLFVIRAEGESMNKSSINGKNIENGDFIIVDSSLKNPKNYDIVVAVIDDNATIKQFIKKDNYIILNPQSTKNYTPIFLTKEDNLIINGQVIDVIKKI